MNKNFKYILIGLVTVLILAIMYVFTSFTKNGFGPGLADYTYTIAGSCNLVRSSVDIIIIGCDGIDESIGPKVVRVGWDGNFLVATTHPFLDDQSTAVPDELNEAVTYWWIIDLKNKIQYGPLNSEEEYNNKKDELKSGDIELMLVDEAKTKGTWINGDFKNE